MPEVCPVDGCGSTHDTYTAVAMHMCKMDDEGHPWETQNGALEHLADEGLIGVGSGGAGDVVDTSEPPEPDTSADTSEPTETAADGGNPLVGDADPDTVDDGGNADVECCDDPNLIGSVGEFVVGQNHIDEENESKEDGNQGTQEVIVLDRKIDTPLKLDAGDRVCMNCDTIHEGAE